MDDVVILWAQEAVQLHSLTHSILINLFIKVGLIT